MNKKQSQSPNIIIFLESNVKKVTISTFLNKDNYNYKIFATSGHITEVSNSGYHNLGISNFNDFEPEYQILKTKEKLVEFWKKYLEENPSSLCIISTDLDREGEAIGKQLVKILNLSKDRYIRLRFNEITEQVITEKISEAIESWKRKEINKDLSIDENLVESQMARQMVDRIIGYCVSEILRKNIKSAWSAGRVQSLVLKMIVDREKRIIEYGDKKYFFIEGGIKISGKKITFVLKSNEKPVIFEDNQELLSSKIDELNNSIFTLFDKEEKDLTIFSKQPLTTSSLLYESKRNLNLSISETTSIIQELYEGIKVKENGKKRNIGLITYPRTDSTRISKIFEKSAFVNIREKWGNGLWNPNYNRKRKDTTNVQDAHEAIRPTYLRLTPDYLEDKLENEKQKHLKVYTLIYNHTLKSFLIPAKIKKYIYRLKSPSGYVLETSENIFTSKGFITIDKNDSNVKKRLIKEERFLNEDNLKELSIKEFKTKEYLGDKPQRFEDGGIIIELKKVEAGRSSTYNNFFKILMKRRYILVDYKKLFYPTELGIKVSEWLGKHFSNLINEKYTRKLEEGLSNISKGNHSYPSFIKDFFEDFFENYKKVE